ncbi:hypothetical protein C0Q44_08605 [Paenibacillus sp. PCH8]|uniref:hypothetical protein n=1 Tax=Paenibacillus sp. PCH8 TaxID=2066524 RepID=UPI000CFA47E9|nr:hypothetical protein [Paenibacillus sp. PCH8]PQP84601.1 hypothetical protein C0Q44_08605 [Paenibacillus sp. PCH8]
MISEKDFVVKTFRENFSDFKNRRIVLYGIGFHTQAILSAFPDFNVIGLMDPVRTGDIYNKKILTFEEASELDVEAIIVIARSKSVKIIFNRISNLYVDSNVILYDVNKNNLFELFDDQRISDENELYFQVNEDSLKEEILKHEAISFDIFDTLMMRKVLYPQDVFDLVEGKALQIGLSVQQFRQKRAESERSLLMRTNPNIYEIYEELQDLTQISSEEKEELLALELATEKEVLIKREKMVELLQYAVAHGKDVYLISDMYLPKTILLRYLSDLGIRGFKDVFVSCEYRTPKCDGLFDIFKDKVKASSYLHIGDNYDADYTFAKLHGLDSFHIKSSLEMLEISSYRSIFKSLTSINDRSLLGLQLSRVFNNPFALYQSDGRPKLISTYDVGYSFVAPIITNFVLWLLKASKEGNYDKILFLARDGYLIQKLYQQATRILNMEIMPENEYFLTSRMICAGSSIVSREDIIEIAKIPFTDSPEELLKTRFSLENIEILSYNPKITVEEYVLMHETTILSRSSVLKENYMKYIRQFNFSKEDKIAVFDFVSTGTCQMYLTDLLPCELTGLYFLNYKINNLKKNQLSIKAFYENDFTYQTQSYIFENYNFMELVVTSFEPSLASFDEDTNPIYRPEKRTEKEMKYLSEMHQAITDFCCDYILNVYQQSAPINNMVSEVMYSFIQGKFTNIENESFYNMVLIDDFGVGEIEVVC